MTLFPNYASGVTAVLAYTPDAIFRAPVLAWYVEEFDSEDSPVICSPMYPDECGQLLVARAPVVGLEFPGCASSNWTQRITAWEQQQEQRRATAKPRFDPFAAKPRGAV